MRSSFSRLYSLSLASALALSTGLQLDAFSSGAELPTRSLLLADSSKASDTGHRIPRPSLGDSTGAAKDGVSSRTKPYTGVPGASDAAATGDLTGSNGTAAYTPMGGASEEETPASSSSLDDLRNQLEGIQKEAAASGKPSVSSANRSTAKPGASSSSSSSTSSSNTNAQESGTESANAQLPSVASPVVPPAKDRLLQGSIDQYGEAKQQAFNIGLGIIAKHDPAPKSSSSIIKTLPDSPAERAGVRAGDRLLKETLDKDTVHLTLQRGARTLEISIKSGGTAMFELTANSTAPLSAGVTKQTLNAGAGINTLNAGTGVTTLKAGADTNVLKAGANKMSLKANVVEQMRDHDVVLILDMSGSMQTRDCQGLSRWDWVGRQSGELASAAQQASSDLTLMLFSSGYQVMEHVSPSLIPMVFQRVRPMGGTILGAPLDDTLNRYFQARQMNPKTKPLIVTIITDGLPNDYGMVRQRIIDAANATNSDGEVSITFLLVNGQLSGNRQMEELDSQLPVQRDIVNLVEFDQVLQLGVKQALFEALSGRQLRNVPLTSPYANPMSGIGSFLGGRGNPFRNSRQNIQNFPQGQSGMPYPGGYNPSNQYGRGYNGSSGSSGVRTYP